MPYPSLTNTRAPTLRVSRSAPTLRGSGSAVLDQDTAQPEPLQEPCNMSGDQVSETTCSIYSSGAPLGLEGDSSPDEYTYQPLQHGKHIRLLVLSSHSTASPSAPDDPMSATCVIHATLKTIELNLDGSSPQPYRALSYEWGPPPQVHTDLPTINLDGHTVRVRQNLHDALKAIIRAGFNKSSDAPMPLWIDALCINQGDDREKGHQVELMRDIFAAAETVLVWLGRLGEEAEEAMETMCNPRDSTDGEFFDESLGLSFAGALSSMNITTLEQHSIFPTIRPRIGRTILSKQNDSFRHIWQIVGIGRRELSIMSQKKEASAIYIRTRKTAMGIAKLCSASYWRRVWIIQEFVMANDYVILCGNYFVKKRRFEEVLELTVTEPVARGQVYCSWVGFQYDNHPTYQAFWSPAFEMIKLRETRLKGVTTTLAEWMRLCVMNDFRATDPRDYVYALLGISNDCTGMITPDYTQAVRDVFKEAVRVLCYHDHSGYKDIKYFNLCRCYERLMGLSFSFLTVDWILPTAIRDRLIRDRELEILLREE